jgi:hypothetical protein
MQQKIKLLGNQIICKKYNFHKNFNKTQKRKRRGL